MCLRIFPKLTTLKLYGEEYFDESDDESDEESEGETIPLRLLENLSRTIPYIHFEGGTVQSGEETERILHKILDMHLTRVLKSVTVKIHSFPLGLFTLENETYLQLEEGEHKHGPTLRFLDKQNRH